MPDQIDVIAADLDLFTAGEIKALALNVDANLRENPPGGTPVDVGWARANWVPSVGQPYQGDASVKEPTLADVVARQEVADEGLANVLKWKAGDGVIFVTNNVPYIQPLNDGHSTQSPRGFVQAAVALAVRQTSSRGQNKSDRLNAAQLVRANAGKRTATIRATAFQRARDRKPK